MIEMSEVDSLANNIVELTKAPMNLESIKSVILNQYTIRKRYTCVNKRISQIYLAVLEKYYSDGIKLTMLLRPCVLELCKRDVW